MEKTRITIRGLPVTVYSLNTVVVGSGAAGLNAADRLHAFGQTDIAIVTENLTAGTSLNAGSDKQTYYKLTLAGDVRDSVYEVAEALFDGGAMHGDIALVEAALSARCFFRLVEIGVPFPHNRYGEYVGYKTDHDPRQRATSAGPLTSRYMAEKLREQVGLRNIPVFDGNQVIGILTDPEGEQTIGLVTLDLNELDNPDRRYTIFNCTNIVYATGGPAGMYAASVYPESQNGASGIAFEAGVWGKNLMEWQFGVASTGFRWNLSGTYQQALPRYVSTGSDGTGECEFLDRHFESPGRMLDAIFLKGYQWPFDPRKVAGNGSSLIDLLVYHETVIRGRRVFLDYTRNPSAAEKNGGLNASLLGSESCRYLEQSGALFGVPVERLIRMNRPAYELFLSHGIDLEKDRLEIAVSAQHNNGGLYGGIWWESNLKHFFPVGEANGSHGVYRPGGSALNAGQVGSLCAAQYIAHRYGDPPPVVDTFIDQCRNRIEEKIALGETFAASVGKKSTVDSIRASIGERMSRCGAVLRSLDDVRDGIRETQAMLGQLTSQTILSSVRELPQAFRNYDLLLAQFVYLGAMAFYIGKGGKSRGSYLVHEPEGVLPTPGLPDEFRFSCEDETVPNRIMVASLKDGSCRFEWEDARPIPKEDQWFETVWREFMDDGSIR